MKPVSIEDILLGAAGERWYFAGFSKSQEARKTRFTSLRVLDRVTQWVPMPIARDVTQWSQLLLLLALMVIYLYNFRVIDLDRIPFMAGMIKNIYAFLNLGLAGFVLGEVALISTCFASAIAISLAVFAYGMRSGIKALEEM